MDTTQIERELIAQHGEVHAERIRRGLRQAAALWRDGDGDLAGFARAHFISDAGQLEATFRRLERVMEQLDGHFNEVTRALRWASDVDEGPLLACDAVLSAFDASAHLGEDLFRSGIAFIVLLNFPLTTLEERTGQAASYSRRQWAELRLASRFARRVPAEVQQQQATAGAAADHYVTGYNVWMHHLLDAQGRRPFPKGLRLISHWNLRDELKAAYADPAGLERQRLIARVMERIVTQEIPAAVIDDPRFDWDPVTNELRPAELASIEADAPAPRTRGEGREPDTRYRHLLAQFRAARLADPHTPSAPTAIARSFELQRELPEERVRRLLEEVLTSDVAKDLAALIAERLGRKLEPHDLWYDGFKGRSLPEEELTRLAAGRYANAEAFRADIPRLLEQLGFRPEKARFLAERIRVDGARGAGHAWPAMRRGDFPRLRTRIAASGMDYKGFNVAIHELGHNVEQVFSLYQVDSTLLQGVPNNAFTEAFAFVFQSRDLELLGLPAQDAEAERLRVLRAYWQTLEIAGVALVDVAVWHWMYENPEASPAELREAVVRIAREHWDRFYAPLLGGEGSALLGIYSHMIAYPLYLTDYPLGHVIAFQIEEQLGPARAEQGRFGDEIERMTSLGCIGPDAWMVQATGKPVSAEPLIAAARRALGETRR